MEERKTLNIRFPQDWWKNERAEKLRSRMEGRRVTWNELFDEAIGNYIECAERILAKVERRSRTMTDKRYYIAYGSNLNVPQMRMRCPHATILGTANLKGWELLLREARPAPT